MDELLKGSEKVCELATVSLADTANVWRSFSSCFAI
jgi:hypothetical protein